MINYISQSGKVIVISNMEDAHLKNSYFHYKGRLREVENLKIPAVRSYRIYLSDLVESLLSEMKKRKQVDK